MKETTQPPDLLFVTCGGTIDKIYFDAKGEYAVGPPQVAGLLEEAEIDVAELEAILSRHHLLDRFRQWTLPPNC